MSTGLPRALLIGNKFMAEAYIIDAVRTPRGIGKQGKGALAKLQASALAARRAAASYVRN